MASDATIIASDLEERILALLAGTGGALPLDQVSINLAQAMVNHLSSGEIHITLVALANPQSI
jgi:hypothetical protein